jgi:hypothetical protein
VTRVYIDLGTLSTGTGVARAPDHPAMRSLEYLAEAGHEVILVGDTDAVPEALGALATTTVAAAPIELTETAWYLISDAERCRDRSTRLRTVLIGSAPAPGAIHRCDRLSRDLLAAVLEILADEAMPTT